MLSPLQPVRLQTEVPASEGAPPQTDTDDANAATDDANAAAGAKCPDMSRRKQRNPKPFFTSGECEAADTKRGVKRTSSPDGASGDGDLESGADDDDDAPSVGESASAKGEVDAEGESSARRTTPAVSPPSGLSSVAAASSSKASGPPLPQHMLQPMPSLEDLVAKSMLFFGEVNVSSAHTSAPPVPLVMPMVYLLPVPPTPNRSAGETPRYRMYVPSNGPDMLLPPPPLQQAPQLLPGVRLPPPMPPPLLLSSLVSPAQSAATPSPNLPLSVAIPTLTSPESKASVRKTSSSECRRKRSAVSSDALDAAFKSGSGPLDLSTGCSSSSSAGLDALQSDRATPPASPASSCSPRPKDEAAQHQRDIEAHINFLQVKQLELLKEAHPDTHCEECSITFSRHSNYIAHKKYYCSGRPGGAAGKVGAPSLKGPAPAGAGRNATREDEHNKMAVPPPSSSSMAAAAAAAAALGILGMGQGPHDFGKELLLKQQRDLLLRSEAASAAAAALHLLGRGEAPPPPASLLMAALPSPASTTAAAATGSTTARSPSASPSASSSGGRIFVCEGCDIRFRSVSNLQAHQARYCAGRAGGGGAGGSAPASQVRKPEEINAFEAMLKQQQPRFPPALSATEMMSFLSAKTLEHQQKANETARSPPSNGSSSLDAEEFPCTLCGCKQSLDRLQEHFNMHLIEHFAKQHKAQQSKASSEVNQGGRPRLLMSPEEPKWPPPDSKGQRSTDDLRLPPIKRMKRAAEFSEAVAASPKRSPASTPTPASPASPASSEDSKPIDVSDAGQDRENKENVGLLLHCNACGVEFDHMNHLVTHKKFSCRETVNETGGAK